MIDETGGGAAGFDGSFSSQPLKRSVSAGAAVPVSTGLYMNPPTPGSPSGSDVSDSSDHVASSSYVYKPVARTGGVLPPVETTSSSNDPPTSLSLSLPGVDFCEVSNRAAEVAHAVKTPPPTPPVTNTMPLLPVMTFVPTPAPAPPVTLVEVPVPQQVHLTRNDRNSDGGSLATNHKAFMPFNFSAELLAVMQEMVRTEVRSYMAGLEQRNGMCFQAVDGFRNASAKRIGVSRMD